MAMMMVFAVEKERAEGIVTSNPIFKPDSTRESDHLAETSIAWDATMKTTNVPEGTDKAYFVFHFTNVATEIRTTAVTNITVTATNILQVTNSITPVPVTILDVQASCSCTTAQLPTLPWTLAPGTNSQIGVTVDISGKYGTVVKSVRVGTDQGSCELIVQVNIIPAVMTAPSDAERMRQMEVAKVDRQAVFKNDCAACHKEHGEYKYGKALYDADCAICHDAEHRASMVPDLHHLKVPTNEEFWRTWIAHGKAGTFMPAFSIGDGGPLSDMQIDSLAAYLNVTIPSTVPWPQ